MSILNVDKIQPIGSGSTVTVNATDTILTNAQAGVITATSFSGSGANLTGISGGKVLQVIVGTTNTRVTATSNAWLDTNLSASITPSATSSKVLVMVTGDVQADAWKDGAVTVFRGGTGGINLGSATLGIQYLKGISSASGHSVSFNVLDSPSVDVPTSYLVKIINNTGSGNIYLPHNSGHNVNTIILMEIGA